MSIDFGFAYRTLIEYWPMFWYGIKITLLFAFVGTIGGLLIGLLVGAIRGVPMDPLDSPIVKGLKKLGQIITGFYIWIFRGTPMMVQAIFLYYLLKPIIGWTSIEAGLFIISVNTGAYMAEIIRSGIQSIDKGQMEAAKAIGMSNLQMMMHIILPQAIKNTFPSIGNQLIVNIKDSSMLNVISVTELFFQASSVAGSNAKYSEVFFVTAILYLILTTLATWALDFFEKKMNHTLKATSKDCCS